jgi:hypothetical protein
LQQKKTFLKMQRRGKRSDRPKDLSLHEMEQHCRLNSDCNLFCVKNGESWIQVSSLDELPMQLQTEYKNCQQDKRNRVMQASLEDSEYNYEADEEARQQKKKHPKYIMQKMEEKFSNLMAPSKEEPLEFPTQLTSQEKMDKAAFEQPVVLTASRTRGKKCVDDKISYTLIRNRLMGKDVGPEATKIANEKLEDIRIALKRLMNVPDVKFIKLLGVGEYGLAFSICNPSISSEVFVVKYQKYKQENKNADELFVREFEMQKKFFEAGIAPEPKFVELSPNILVMAKLDGTLNDLLENPCSEETLNGILEGIINLISRMCAYNLSHRDLHWGNIGYVFKFDEEQFDTLDINLHPLQRRTDFQLIDFDSSKDEGCDPEAELAQLIRTTFKPSDYGLNEKNMIYLRKQLIALYMKNYPYDPRQVNNLSYWDERHRINFFELPQTPFEEPDGEYKTQSFSQFGSEIEHKGNGEFNDFDEETEVVVPSMPNMEPPSSDQPLWEDPPPMEWDERVNPSLSGYFR